MLPAPAVFHEAPGHRLGVDLVKQHLKPLLAIGGQFS